MTSACKCLPAVSLKGGPACDGPGATPYACGSDSTGMSSSTLDPHSIDTVTIYRMLKHHIHTYNNVQGTNKSATVLLSNSYLITIYELPYWYK